jgi:PTH1 family peptidyl-tRNA hydrolase
VYLIAGLGNPGPGYRNTRHNIGFMVVELWSKQLGSGLKNRRFQSRNTLIKHQDKKMILLCPLTFMNRSGESIRACADYYDIEASRILVIHDDLDLPLGRVKVVRNGGAGGHKGVLSTIRHLGTSEFTRVKIGIGRPRYDEFIEDFVLSSFYPDEKETMGKVIHLAVEACGLFISKGVELTMNQINKKNLANKEVKS